MKKYNIAFVPKSKSKDFVELSTTKTNNPLNYILNDTSTPHVSICQFYLEENDVDALCEKISTEVLTTDIHLSFKKYSHLTFGKSIYWLSLLPEEAKELTSIFICVSKIIKPLRTDGYDPHLTLFNYLLEEKTPKNDFNDLDNKTHIEDEFELVIGECDEVGQLTKIIKVIDNPRDHQLSM